MPKWACDARTVSLRMLRFWGWQEVAGMVLFAVVPDEDKKAPAGCNNVAWLKAWVVHSPLVCSFGVLLIPIGWQRICRLGTCARDEFLRPASRVLHASFPLLSRPSGVRKVCQLLPETM